MNNVFMTSIFSLFSILDRKKSIYGRL